MRNPNQFILLSFCLILGVTIAGCRPGPTHMEMLAVDQSQVATRSIQTRNFNSADRSRIMRAVISSLQDLQFVVDQGDQTLSMVGATKLDNFHLRITVTARPRESSQTLVRANASLNSLVVNDVEFYQDFFVSLERSLFLEAQAIE